MNEQPHILVVDDHRDIRDSLVKYLEKNGYRASSAADAREARKALKIASIDLVILDIMMPGEDGLSLCQFIRQSS
ncbi:MAG: response regulator, partial [Rhodospirillaceae bacterium]|nr:response regulator [Rhodospirillaceae bacterium]